MTDRPIIFSAPMVRALLEGKKTQTRRLLKVEVPPSPGMDSWLRVSLGKPVDRPKHDAPYLDSYCSARRSDANPRGMSENWCWWTRDDRQGLPTFRVGYAPGDRLWVRETFAHATNFPPAVRYYATDDVHELRRKRPAIHMPRWASRLTLTVTQVRVQRLHDITEIDSSDEGAPCCVMDDDGKFYENQGGTYRCGFVGLWNSINGKRTGAAWDDNPWIVALTFTVEKRNIDAKVETAVKKPEAA